MTHDVPLARFGSEAEARLWAELLRQEGIAVVVLPIGGAAAYAPAGIPHELRVRAEDADRARGLLTDLESEVSADA